MFSCNATVEKFYSLNRIQESGVRIQLGILYDWRIAPTASEYFRVAS
ncbi:hypothetical protein [Nostoc sp. NMS4]|nr:hypothetical protein [Nostoc sp. NMS4]MBN3926948.1 hypothetical protein [Nostoc sp. NMS4]